MTPSQAIEQLEAKLAAATPGEWISGIDFSHFNAPELRKPDGNFYVGLDGADAAFIAAIKTASPALLACARALDSLLRCDPEHVAQVEAEARAALNLLAGVK